MFPPLKTNNTYLNVSPLTHRQHQWQMTEKILYAVCGAWLGFTHLCTCIHMMHIICLSVLTEPVTSIFFTMSQFLNQWYCFYLVIIFQNPHKSDIREQHFFCIYLALLLMHTPQKVFFLYIVNVLCLPSSHPSHNVSYINVLLCSRSIALSSSLSCWSTELKKKTSPCHLSFHQAEELCPRHWAAAPRWHGGGIGSNWGSVSWGTVRPCAWPRIPHR